MKKFQFIFFLSSDCPLSQLVTKEINEISTGHPSLQYYVVFPGENGTENHNAEFLKKYGLPLKPADDTDFRISKELNATVTPQAIITDRKEKIIYSGGIDDRVRETGMPAVASKNKYLEKAILSIEKGESPSPAETKAPGCYIEF